MLEISKLAYKSEICLEIEDVLKFDLSEACKCKKVVLGRLAQP